MFEKLLCRCSEDESVAISACTLRENMLACFFCPNTKKLKQIANQAKASKALWGSKAQQIDAEEKVIDRKAKQILTWEKEEWVAEPEQGVLITLVPQTNGGNFIKKIRFSEERFNTMEAQKWWSDNYDKLIELYSICLPPSPYHSEGDEDEINSIQAHKPSTSANSNNQSMTVEVNQDNPIVVEQNSTTFLKGVKGKVVKWVIEDEPGVYVTIRSLPDDTKEIVRVELSQDRFGEVNARVWWEENKARLLEQYL